MMIVVMMFHSFVLVPKSYATVWEATAGRIAMRAFSPNMIATLGSGQALVVGAVVAAGVGYLIYKSGAVQALDTWITNYYQPTHVTDGTVYQEDNPPGVCKWKYNAHHVKIFWSVHYQQWVVWYMNANDQMMTSDSNAGTTYEQAYNKATNGCGYYSPPAIPDTPQDLGGPLATTQPNFSADQIYGSPGVAAAISGAAGIVSAVTMSDSDADKLINGIGAQSISDAGEQAGSPAVTDNTVTAGDAESIGLLQRILNYVSNLTGIKTDTTAMRTSLDNVGVATQGVSTKMDNVIQGINTQTQALEDVGEKVEHLDNTISAAPDATVSSVQTRIDALKDLAATKFPFSLISGISVNEISGTSNYEFTALPLTPSISIPIAPMAGPLSTLFDWIRQLLVWFFWAGTLFAILKKGMEM